MSDPSWLRLLSKIVGHQNHDSSGQSELIPCIHQALERDVDLLSAGAGRSGGRLFDLDTSTGWESPPGPIVKDRLDLVQGMLQAAIGHALPGQIVVTEEHGKVSARLAVDADVPEPSLLLILRAASLIASSAYDQFDLVVIAAGVASTDPDRRELLWKMLTIDPEDLRISGSATTIVPILGADVNPESDYGRQPGIRYIVLPDRLIERPPMTRAHAIKAISQAGDGPLVLFLGAGASASSRIRLGNAYRDLALTEYVGASDVQVAAGALFDLLHEQERFLPGETESRAEFVGTLTLERVLRETFADLGARPRSECRVIQELTADCEQALEYVRAGRAAIRELAARLRGKLVIVTVNFDRLVEVDLGVPCQVLSTPSQFGEGLEDVRAYLRGDANKPVPVLKLHGSIEDVGSLIATIDTTAAGLHDSVRAALNVIVEESQSRPVRWVWVGCSMRDRDVNAWLGGLSTNALDEWWVDPFPGKSLDDFINHYRAPRWSSDRRIDRLIVDSADVFLRAVAESVTAG